MAAATTPARTAHGEQLPYAGITTEQVKQVQAELGVTVDGVRGKQSQAAWEQAMAAQSQAEWRRGRRHDTVVCTPAYSGDQRSGR